MDVARELLELWRLPPALHEVVSCHHMPHRAKRFPQEAMVVHVADLIVNAMELGTFGEINVPAAVPGAWEFLEIDVNVLPLLIEQVDDEYETAVNLMMGSIDF